jgi:hemerythrin-like domain-containing protein
MAKRHQSLIPLSHDHHHALALALRLRQGDDALLNDGWTHDREEQARRVKKFYDEELRLHFIAEEHALFPVIRKEIPDSTSLIESLLLHHREMERLISAIADAKGNELDAQLRELGALLDKHIRLEERELFPLYQATIGEKLAGEIGEEIKRVRDVRTFSE